MLKSGQMFGNYRIVDKIGVGGMGAVYLAEHPSIGKQVALKVIHRELAANQEVITRFFNEARAANQIGNEHIVNIHDFGVSEGGENFYIMEFLEGRTLAQVLTQSPTLNPQRVLHIAAQMASGLEAAHQRQIVHRDLKPDNVMLVNRLGDADFVKILDFGLAKVLDAEHKLTGIGVVLGTPQYMSPEACESRRDIDHRADIYALGILMFQMLCGRVPFQGETMGEVLIRQVTKLPPAPRALNPAIPPSVEQIVLRCLAKSPDQRFQSMRHLRGAVLAPEKYLASSPPVVQSAGQIADASPRSTQFWGGGAPDNNPNMAPPEMADLGPPPSGQKTAFLGSGDSKILRTLPPVDPAAQALAAVAAAPPAHALKTQYAPGQGGPTPTVPPPGVPAAVPAHAQKTQYAQVNGGAQPAHAQKTAFMAPSSASVSEPPRPARESVKTAFMAPGSEVGAPPAAGSASQGATGAEAKTAFMAPGAPLSVPFAMPPPELSPPTPAHNRTMAIAPPVGYKDHPPPTSSPLWIAVGVISAAAAFGVLAFLWPGFLNESGERPSRSAPVAAKVAIDAAPAPPPATPDAAPTPPPPRRVSIEIITDPAGARVVRGDGVVLLENTPGIIEMDASDQELELVFRHPKTEDETTKIVPSADAKIRLDLPKKKRSGGRGGSGTKPPRDRDGTLVPSFD